MLRKVAVAAASNPHVEIRQDGEQFYIKTSTSVRTTEINFHIGEEFDEETVDGRKCKVKKKKNKTFKIWYTATGLKPMKMAGFQMFFLIRTDIFCGHTYFPLSTNFLDI